MVLETLFYSGAAVHSRDSNSVWSVFMDIIYGRLSYRLNILVTFWPFDHSQGLGLCAYLPDAVADSRVELQEEDLATEAEQPGYGLRAAGVRERGNPPLEVSQLRPLDTSQRSG